MVATQWECGTHHRQVGWNARSGHEVILTCGWRRWEPRKWRSGWWGGEAMRRTSTIATKVPTRIAASEPPRPPRPSLCTAITIASPSLSLPHRYPLGFVILVVVVFLKNYAYGSYGYKQWQQQVEYIFSMGKNLGRSENGDQKTKLKKVWGKLCDSRFQFLALGSIIKKRINY